MSTSQKRCSCSDRAKSFAENYPQYIYIDAILSEEGKKRLALLERGCGTDLADRVVDILLSQMLNSLVDGLVSRTGRGDAVGTVPLEMPAMIPQGLKDKTILPQFTHRPGGTSRAARSATLSGTCATPMTTTRPSTSRHARLKAVAHRLDDRPMGWGTGT
ncbi:MAG: hypothetical protein IPG68_16100 [Micrococcales bacterium]|nr:hypothetical protein [Micrococcales bacterium]